MAKRIWVAKMNCQMPFRDFARGEEIELDDENVTARVKALFECRDKEEKVEAAADFKVMLARLKAAKIQIPRGATKEKIKELFDTFLVKGALASSIAGDDAGIKEEEKADTPVEEKKAEVGEKPAEEKGKTK